MPSCCHVLSDCTRADDVGRHPPVEGADGVTYAIAATLDKLLTGIDGMPFAICQMATRRLAGQIATSVGSTPEAIYEAFVANIVPNGRMVATGVVSVTRAHESVLIAG